MAKKSIKIEEMLYLRLVKEARELKRTFTGHLEDIIEKHFTKGAKA